MRHGETTWTDHRAAHRPQQYSFDSSREEEPRALNPRFRDRRFSDVFTSPLRRARRTCELADFGAVARADADLVEWDYGDYEGRRTSEIRADRPTWHLLADGCPNGESAADVGARADRIIDRVRRLTGNVLLVAHRDIFRVMAARWLDLASKEGRRLYLDTGSVSILGYDHTVDEPVIRLWTLPHHEQPSPA